MRAGASLVELDLSHNAFGPNVMKGLAEFLRSPSCFTLEELRLENTGLGPAGGRVRNQLPKCFNVVLYHKV